MHQHVEHAQHMVNSVSLDAFAVLDGCIVSGKLGSLLCHHLPG